MGEPETDSLCEDRLQSLLPIGERGYVEVVLRRVPGTPKPIDFIVIARGYLKADGSKRGTKFVTMPATPEAVEWLSKTLEGIAAVMADIPDAP